MKKYILFILIGGLSFSACNNPYEKEIGMVEALIVIVNDTESSLFSVDTANVIATKRQMGIDLAEFSSIKDTLSRKDAFKMGDIFGSKKKIYRLTTNYKEFIKQIEFSRNQLNNLKQDLENGLINKKDFKAHYIEEQTAVMKLNSQINKAVEGLEVGLQKFKLDRPEFLEILNRRRSKQ